MTVELIYLQLFWLNFLYHLTTFQTHKDLEASSVVGDTTTACSVENYHNLVSMCKRMKKH